MKKTTDEKDKPIIFSSAMVKAILEGRKTQTRRVVKLTRLINLYQKHTGLEPAFVEDKGWVLRPQKVQSSSEDKLFPIHCPYGQTGSRLWVRETWKAFEDTKTLYDYIQYKADNGLKLIPDTAEAGAFVVGRFDKWYPPIFMPRWASRINLEITNIRVEKLQEISEKDACAEGISSPVIWGVDERSYLHDTPNGSLSCSYVAAFSHGWDSINGKRKGCSWSENPFVWVIEFKKQG